MTRVVIDKNSPAYKRVTEAGFDIFNPELRKGYYIHCNFSCVCGKVEELFIHLGQLNFIEAHWHFKKKNSQKYIWDAAQCLEDLGAISVEHLREDGYSEEQIKEIRKAYA